MIRIVIAGLQKDRIKKSVLEAGGERVEALITTDMDAAKRVKTGQADYYIGACNSGGGAALSIVIGLLGYSKCATVAKSGANLIHSRSKHLSTAVQLPLESLKKVLKRLLPLSSKACLRNISNLASILIFTKGMGKIDWNSLHLIQPLTIMQFIVVMCLTALTALAAHLGKAVFHDGIRPILPEVIEARMNRRELASIASGLSFGFIVSVGISFAFSFQMLNPWLLFLPTDILGILATRWWIALVLGAAWGATALFGLAGVLSLATMLPIDIIDPLSQLNVGFLVAVAVFLWLRL